VDEKLMEELITEARVKRTGEWVSEWVLFYYYIFTDIFFYIHHYYSVPRKALIRLDLWRWSGIHVWVPENENHDQPHACPNRQVWAAQWIWRQRKWTRQWPLPVEEGGIAMHGHRRSRAEVEGGWVLAQGEKSLEYF
jgi:hypothetical protein